MSEPTPKWIRFEAAGRSASGKTLVFRVLEREEGLLGTIAWFGRWRRYAFFPEPKCVFEQTCLRDIAAFCERETRAHHKEPRR